MTISNSPATTSATAANIFMAARAFACALLLICARATAMTEAQFIAKVLTQDKLLEEAQINIDIKQIELDTSRDNYQNWKAELGGRAEYRYRDLDRVTTSNSAYDKRIIAYPQSVEIGIEKKFLSNPSSLSALIRHGKTREQLYRYKKITPEEGNPIFEQDYATTQRIRFKYPLLKHDSNAAQLKTYHRNILDLRAQELSFLETKEDFLEDRLQDYFAWALHQRSAHINLAFIEKYKRIKTGGDADAALLKSALSRIENDIAENQTEARAVVEKLAVLLDDKTLSRASPNFNLNKRAAPPPPFPEKYLRAHSRDLARIGVSIKLRKIDIAHLRNQLLPSLDFTIEAERINSTANTRTSDVRDDRISYAGGITFTYPLGGSISNRASLQIAQLGLRKLEISYAEKLQDLLADMQLLHARLRPDATRLNDAVNAASQSAEIEYRNYRAGQTSLRNLLQAYSDWRDAEIDRVENLIDYHEDRVEYDNLLDRMLIQ